MGISPVQQKAIEKLKSVVSAGGFIETPSEMTPYITDVRGRFAGTAALVAMPSTTKAVSEIVKICAQNSIAITPQGGNTGLCGAAVPGDEGANIVLSLKRMNRIRELDPANFAMTVEAGCVLKRVQEAAEQNGRLFPLSLGAEGSCMIGGNLSTNAGGIAVLRYGNMRDLVLGLEVVLADGTVWNGLRGLRKDNTGYDLKNLFIGAEGTLGIITAATLKLFTPIKSRATALAAFDRLDDLIPLFEGLRKQLGDELIAFEYFPRFAIDLAVAYVPGITEPFREKHSQYLLIEIGASNETSDVRGRLEDALAYSVEQLGLSDALLAQSQAQAASFWRIREGFVEAQQYEGARLMHDVSIPLSDTVKYIREASERCRSVMSDVRPFAFGHVGDGNVHFNLLQPKHAEPGPFLSQKTLFEQAIYESAAQFKGSFSAEHGVGSTKTHAMISYKDPVELKIMSTIKAALDPKNLFNPGKVLPSHL